jgi:hypothetical protein
MSVLLFLSLNLSLLTIAHLDKIKENINTYLPDFSILFQNVNDKIFLENLDIICHQHKFIQENKKNFEIVLKHLKVRDWMIKMKKIELQMKKLRKEVIIELQQKFNKDKVINDIKNKIEKFDNKTHKYKLYLGNKNCVIINLELYYDYDINEWKDSEKLKELICHSILNKTPVILIGEKNPKDFLPILNKTLNAFFNNSNYITPYHYTNRFLDNPKKLPDSKISSKPCFVSINQMLEDIIDEYQLKHPYLILKEEKDIKKF